MFGADVPAAQGPKTFEPGEGMVEVEPAEAQPVQEAVPAPVRKGPTPAQLTAIKVRTTSAICFQC